MLPFGKMNIVIVVPAWCRVNYFIAFIYNDALMSATDHPNHEVVRLALGEIAKLNDERSLAALASAIDHTAEAVRKCAAELLGHAGSDGESILRTRLDRERSADVRHAIMQALAVR